MFAMCCIGNTFRVISEGLELSAATEILKGNIMNAVSHGREVSGSLLRRSPGSRIGGNSGRDEQRDKLGAPRMNLKPSATAEPALKSWLLDSKEEKRMR